MEAGRLKHRIRIEKWITDESDFEYPVKKWVEHCTVWADVQDLSTKDSLVAQQVGSNLTARAVVRYSKFTDSITYDMRVFFEGQYYQVNGRPKRGLGDRKTYLTIELKEGLDEWKQNQN